MRVVRRVHKTADVSRCQYCGVRTARSKLCTACYRKVKLIRTIQAMIMPVKLSRDARRKVEQ